MNRLVLAAALTAVTSLCAHAERVERTEYQFDFVNKKPAAGVIAVNSSTIYADSIGYGYDLQPAWDGKSNAPFYFSVNVPDGNYRVTVTLGSKRKAGVTTVRAESRRLFVESEATAKGKSVTHTFVVNKRNVWINDKERVKIKDREKTKLNWDDKLTLEFNGDAPCVQSIRIERDDTVPTVFLCGNSTVVDQENEPWASWGQMITRFMDDKVAIANYAESGETADGFIGRGRLKKLLTVMKPGDYIFMEFGHNDQKQDGRMVGAGAFYSFQHQLKIFIDEARKRGAQPVLVTPTMRRAFENGVNQATHKDYPEAIHFVAEREQLPLVDLQAMTKTFYEALGEEPSKHAFVHYPAGTYPGQTQDFADNTHFNPYGADEISKLVLLGIQKAGLPLADHINADFKGFDPAHPDDFTTFHWNDSPFVEIEKPDGN
jgi:lysophospholipase L1-like esterase